MPEKKKPAKASRGPSAKAPARKRQASARPRKRETPAEAPVAKREEAATPSAAPVSPGHAPLFGADGKRTGEHALPTGLFTAESAGAVVHQAVVAALANARLGTASTRNRSRVSGGGAKPWRQKGTGRARQGSIRAPHWRHGAVVFGPNGRVYAQRVPRKMRRLALAAALSTAAREGRVGVLEEMPFTGGAARTKDASSFLARLGAGAVDTLIVTSEGSSASLRAFANLPTVLVRTPRSLRLTDVLVADRLLFAKAALDAIAEERA